MDVLVADVSEPLAMLLLLGSKMIFPASEVSQTPWRHHPWMHLKSRTTDFRTKKAAPFGTALKRQKEGGNLREGDARRIPLNAERSLEKLFSQEEGSNHQC